HCEAIARLAVHDERRVGHALAARGSLPLRRQRHARRHRTATGALRDRTLLRGPPPSHRIRETMSIAQRFVSMEYGPAPEDPKEALTWLDGHKRKFSHFIGGEWRAPQPAEYFDSNDPSNGELLAKIAQGSTGDVDAAVKSARAAFPAWQALKPHIRARYLYAIARQVQKHSRR